jgi:hypothetical protein
VVEIWFSILVRKLLRRGNFTSKQHLQQQIGSFIAYFNATMAKPFRWTMKGKPLVAWHAKAGWDFQRGALVVCDRAIAPEPNPPRRSRSRSPVALLPSSPAVKFWFGQDYNMWGRSENPPQPVSFIE